MVFNALKQIQRWLPSNKLLCVSSSLGNPALRRYEPAYNVDDKRWVLSDDLTRNAQYVEFARFAREQFCYAVRTRTAFWPVVVRFAHKNKLVSQNSLRSKTRGYVSKRYDLNITLLTYCFLWFWYFFNLFTVVAVGYRQDNIGKYVSF